MTIERIGPSDPVQNVKKSGKSDKPGRSAGADSISLSEEAKSKAEVYQATEMVKNAPDIRWERVEQVKKKLQDPSYISEKVISEVADKILDLFGIS